MKNTGRKTKKERRRIFFHFVRGRAVTRVYSQREYERNVYTFLAILYLVPCREMPFIFRQKGVIALLEKARIPGKCKETGAASLKERLRVRRIRRRAYVRY